MTFSIKIFTPEHDFNRESEIVTRLFDIGLETLHLRKPFHSKADLISYLNKIPSAYHSRIVVHQHYELSTLFGLKGNHLKSSFQGLIPSKLVSRSFHSYQEINDWKSPLEYGFLSPIFNSLSKEGYYSPFVREELINIIPQFNIPIIALGGVAESNIGECKKMGFSGAAVLGSVWQSTDPIMAFNQLIRII